MRSFTPLNLLVYGIISVCGAFVLQSVLEGPIDMVVGLVTGLLIYGLYRLSVRTYLPKVGKWVLSKQGTPNYQNYAMLAALPLFFGLLAACVGLLAAAKFLLPTASVTFAFFVSLCVALVLIKVVPQTVTSEV